MKKLFGLLTIFAVLGCLLACSTEVSDENNSQPNFVNKENEQEQELQTENENSASESENEEVPTENSASESESENEEVPTENSSSESESENENSSSETETENENSSSETENEEVPTDNSVDLTGYYKVESSESNPYEINYIYAREIDVLRFFNNDKVYLKPIKKIYSDENLKFTKIVSGSCVPVEYVYKCEIYLKNSCSNYSWDSMVIHYLPNNYWSTNIYMEVVDKKLVANTDMINIDTYLNTGVGNFQ